VSAAKEAGMSLNEYIIAAIEERMARDAAARENPPT